MPEAPKPANEAMRVAALHALGILDTPPEERFDRITRVARALFDVPIALVSLVDSDRQWFKSCQGLDYRESARSISFCAYALHQNDPLIVPDARQDARFADNPLVTGSSPVRFYAGQPLTTTDGYRVGTLCVIDRRPREISTAEVARLQDLAAWTELELRSVDLREALQRQREAQDAVLRAEAQLRAVLDAVSDALVLVAPGGEFLAVNDAFRRLFGIEPEEVLGRNFRDLRDHVVRIFEDPRAFITRFTDTAQDEERRFSEIVVQAWPQARDLYLYSTPVHNHDGRHLGRLFVWRDVTRERELDRMKSEFVSTVSHELRTPLTSIKGYLDLLLEGEITPLQPEQRRFLSVVGHNTDRLVDLVADLMDVSRIEAGNLKLNVMPVDLPALVDDIVSLFRPMLEAKDQVLRVSVPDSMPHVLGDPARVNQILTNLLSNATKYTPAGGQIDITLFSEGGWGRVEVSDTGVGLTAEEQSRLFTKFFRARNRMTEDVEGTGLGLAITRSLTEMQGGTITVASAPGRGSTFTVSLPVDGADSPE